MMAFTVVFMAASFAKSDRNGTTRFPEALRRCPANAGEWQTKPRTGRRDHIVPMANDPFQKTGILKLKLRTRLAGRMPPLGRQNVPPKHRTAVRQFPLGPKKPRARSVPLPASIASSVALLCTGTAPRRPSSPGKGPQDQSDSPIGRINVLPVPHNFGPRSALSHICFDNRDAVGLNPCGRCDRSRPTPTKMRTPAKPISRNSTSPARNPTPQDFDAVGRGEPPRRDPGNRSASRPVARDCRSPPARRYACRALPDRGRSQPATTA